MLSSRTAALGYTRLAEKDEALLHEGDLKDDETATVAVPVDFSRVFVYRLVGGAALFAVLAVTTAFWLFTRPVVDTARSLPTEPCPHFSYDNGRWEKKAAPALAISNEPELLAAAGFRRCAFDNENLWEFFGSTDAPDFSSRVAPFSYEWHAHDTCHLRGVDELQKLQVLVDGPLAIIGDSLQRQLFFTLSCELGEHLVWNGVPPPSSPSIEEMREWRFNDQQLFLNPNSPLMAKLRLPAGFSLERPLISFFSMWLPQSYDEMAAALGEQMPWMQPPDHWYGYELQTPMNATIDRFVDPKLAIRTAIFTIGPHFSQGVHFEKAPSSAALLPVARWSIRTYLEELRRRMGASQRVIVRASPPGLRNHDQIGPLTEVAMPADEFNWQSMPDIADILRDETLLLMDSRFSWMGGERPARMRPDAHTDGMHYGIGTGVLESVSRYVWHLLSD